MSMLNEFALAALNSLSAHIAVVNNTGEIIAVNDKWRSFAIANGATSNVMENSNYLDVCDNAVGTGIAYAQQASKGLRSILSGKQNIFELEYPCHAPSEHRWFILRITRFIDNNINYAVVAHENITDRKLAEQVLYQQAHDAAIMGERQRLSRELHDGVNQALFSSMSIARTIPRILQQDQKRALSLIDEVINLNQAAIAEMQILLRELRPGMILKTKLSSLILQLSEIIKVRTSANVILSIKGDEVSHPPDVHFTLYRISQEAITNIIKHSHATQVEIVLTFSENRTIFEIKDNGKGFDQTSETPNIGLLSMEERAEGIKADLKINSRSGTGTEVIIEWSLHNQY